MPNVYRDCPSCGAEMKLFVTGNRRDAERKADWMLSKGHICDHCLKKQRDEENAAAAESNKGMAALAGTDKQIAWAETIRKQFIDSLDRIISLIRSGDATDTHVSAFAFGIRDVVSRFSTPDDISAFAEKLKIVLLGKDKASWWIDSRSFNLAYVATRLIDQIAALDSKPNDDIAAELKALELQAMDEATVRPVNTKTAIVAEIHFDDKRVTVHTAEYVSEAHTILQSAGYQYGVNTKRWVLTAGPTMGNLADRAADIGNRLLVAGVPVAILDEDVRRMAIDGDFDHLWPRWVAGVKDDAEKRYVDLIFENDRNLIREIGELTRARVDIRDTHVRVRVRTEKFQSILDFADKFGFRFTPGGEELLALAEKRFMASVIGVEVTKTPAIEMPEDRDDTVMTDGIDRDLADE